MLEKDNVEIPELMFQGWGTPEAIEVFYYIDPITRYRVSSGFSIIYSANKESLVTDNWMNKLEKTKLDKVIIKDKTFYGGESCNIETTYLGLSNVNIENDGSFLIFEFSSDSSLTYLLKH